VADDLCGYNASIDNAQVWHGTSVMEVLCALPLQTGGPLTCERGGTLQVMSRTAELMLAWFAEQSGRRSDGRRDVSAAAL
jgi:hypothetical protein